MASITIDQPVPADISERPGQPCALELFTPGGQPVAVLIFQEVAVEDIVLTVLPAFRRQTGIQSPLSFKVRALTLMETQAIASTHT